MKLVFSSDSFKGSLSSSKINELLIKASGAVFNTCETVPLILADGGEGTLDAVLSVKKGRKNPVTVHDPLMNTITAYYGSFDDGKALVEMAQASGLTLVPEKNRDPWLTGSHGTGELIRTAVETGHKDIIIAIGGSATNDGGIGMLTALGIKFLDEKGKQLKGIGSDLARIADIDLNGIMPELKDTHITVMCDVTNPLCGPLGASFVFGPQKGADEKKVKLLEAGMKNYRDILISRFRTDPDSIPGAGAAGGMGAALKIFLGAELCSGIETLLDLCDYDSLISGADLIITGEGRIDSQSCAGKAVQGVGLRAKKAGIPCIAICGCTGEGYEKIREYGISDVAVLAAGDISREYAMVHAEQLYYEKAISVMKQIAMARLFYQGK